MALHRVKGQTCRGLGQSIPGREHCKGPKIVTSLLFYWKRNVSVTAHSEQRGKLLEKVSDDKLKL